jgi:hypothetical protein
VVELNLKAGNIGRISISWSGGTVSSFVSFSCCFEALQLIEWNTHTHTQRERERERDALSPNISLWIMYVYIELHSYISMYSFQYLFLPLLTFLYKVSWNT